MSQAWKNTSDPAFEPRSVCARCARPTRVCVCEALSPLTTRTRVVMLQHPRESDVPINTARIATLQLENAERHVAVKLSEVPKLAARLTEPGARVALLYPGEGAADLSTLAPSTDGAPVTLLVLDGTWWQAKKLFQQNPELARLPRYSLNPSEPSRYRIRREPALHCISTIEAIAEALLLLEPAGFDRERFLRPFEAMVEHQLHFAQGESSRRHLAYRSRPKLPRVPKLLRERATDLVVAYGEANAWPRGSELGGDAEIVHWVAERVATGERFEAILAPRRPLSPSFATHARLDPALALSGESLESFHARWRAFLKPSDLLAGWGWYSSERLSAEGVVVPDRIDLRTLARHKLRRKTGEVGACARELGAKLPEPWAPGRAGERLAAALAVARALLGEPGSS